MTAEIESYKLTLEVFESLVVLAIRTSDASGGIYTDNLSLEANKVFTRLTLAAMTVDAVLPGNQINKLERWDMPSVATLTRTFIETCQRHLYLSEQNLTVEDSDFRVKLCYFHLNNEKYRLYAELGASPQVLASFEENLPKARERLEMSPVFLSLSKAKRNQISAGKIDILFTDVEVAERFHMFGGEFKGIYRLLFNQAHGSPFATFSQSNVRGRGIENEVEETYLILMIKLLSHCLAKVVIAQTRMLSLLVLSAQDMAQLNSCSEVD